AIRVNYFLTRKAQRKLSEPFKIRVLDHTLLLGDEFLEFFTSGERRHRFGGDFQFFAGLRVAANASGAFAGLERTETNQGHFLTFSDGLFDGRNGMGEDLSDLLLRSLGFLGYLLY